jgi:Spy/CpxP family protein refolding chaperone
MRWIYGLSPVLLVAIVGCGANAPEAKSPVGSPELQEGNAASAPASEVVPAGTMPVEDQDESTADLHEHHRHHHHGGFAMFVAMSLDYLGTTPEQNTALTKIERDMYSEMQPAYDAEKHVLSTIADGVAAGNIDRTKVETSIAQSSAAASRVDDAVAGSLNQLHAVLTPPQRIGLVDKIDAHFEVWNDVNTADETANRDAHGGHLAKVAKELGMSPDQVEKSRANFKSSFVSAPVHYDRKEGEEYVKAFGIAFESETFDATTLGAGGSVNAHIATWGATRMARFYEAVTPVLTSDQRTKLADALRRHSSYQRTFTGN